MTYTVIKLRDGPLYIAGETKDVGHERSSTPARYELVAEVLAQYRRPFTVLDIGASLGYFGLRAAHEYDCAAVLVETGSSLPPVAQQNAAAGNDRAIVLSRKLTVEDLEALAASEAFDVVLALNVLHWFGGQWRPALDAILELGDNVIIETPPRQDAGALGQAVVPAIHEALETTGGGRELGSTPSHTTAGVERPVYCFSRPKRALRRAYIGAPANVNVRPHVIESTPDERVIMFAGAGQGPRPWHPGINLRTYLELGGAWPLPDELVRQLEDMAFPIAGHGDLRPHNIIIDGRRAVPIDGKDEDPRAIYADVPTLTGTIEAVRAHGAP